MRGPDPDAEGHDDPWWPPEDIDAPPTAELITPTPVIFTYDEVDRVLRDL